MHRKILVLAPRFPSINQPWLDNYLEQLITSGFDPLIYTTNSAATEYHQKVDDLRLLEHIAPFSLSKSAIARSVISKLYKLRMLVSSWQVARRAALSGDLLITFFRTLHITTNARLFDGIELVHSHSEIPAYQLLPLADSRGIPLVITFHGLPPAGVGQLSADKRSKLYAEVDLVFVNTEFAKRQVCDLGCPPDKVQVLPQGLPLEDFPFSNRRLRKSSNELALLTVGRSDRQKGHAYALIALRRLLNHGLSVMWTFVGDGPDLKRIRVLVSKLGLENNVTIIHQAKLEQLRQLYSSADFFILPSIATPGWQETQGVVLQEAQATGCIPIATKTGGIEECINHGIDGFLIKQKSSRAIAEVILEMLSMPDHWETMRQSARRNVEDRFSAEIIGKKMAEALENLIHSQKSRP